MSQEWLHIFTSLILSTRWSKMLRTPSLSSWKSANLSAPSGKISWLDANSSSSTSLKSTPPSHACTPWEIMSPALKLALSQSFTTLLLAPESTELAKTDIVTAFCHDDFKVLPVPCLDHYCWEIRRPSTPWLQLACSDWKTRHSHPWCALWIWNGRTWPLCSSPIIR